MMTGESTASVDADLVAAVVEGDRQAFRLLYDRHAPWLTVRLSRRCADQDLVDDAVQDTFVTVWRDASRYEGRGDVAAWIWADHLEIGRLELLKWHGIRTGEVPPAVADAVFATLARPSLLTNPLTNEPSRERPGGEKRLG